jgi:hypothetical protein
LSYEWRLNTLSSSVVGTNNTFTTAYTGNIFVSMVQPAGSGCYKWTKVRLIHPVSCQPVVLETPENPYILCYNYKGFLTPTIPGGGSFDSVQWFKDGNYLEGLDGADTLFFTKWSIGDYYGIAWFMGTQSNVTNTVWVNRFDIRIKQGDGYLCPNETVTLVAPPLHQPTLYEWYEGVLGGTVLLSGNTDSIFTTSYVGNVWCRMTHDEGCYKYNKFRVYADPNCPPIPGMSNKTDGLTDNSLEAFETAVFPNPNNGTFKLTIAGLTIDQPVVIEMFEINGRKVSEVTYTASDNVEEFQLNNSVMAAGIYSIRVSHLDNVSTKRVVVQ